MARVVIAPSADADTDFVLADLASKAGRRVSAKYDNLFDKLYERLAAHPAIGAVRRRIGKDIRIGIVSPYIVIYRYTADSDTVTVLRIVHGRRRITGKLLSEG
jgi:toxin ParE1/3/4